MHFKAPFTASCAVFHVSASIFRHIPKFARQHRAILNAYDNLLKPFSAIRVLLIGFSAKSDLHGR
jgi:hypothetical protein